MAATEPRLPSLAMAACFLGRAAYENPRAARVFSRLCARTARRPSRGIPTPQEPGDVDDGDRFGELAGVRTSEATIQASDPAARRSSTRRRGFGAVLLLTVLACYLGSYGWLRAQHELIRIGHLYNVRRPDGTLALQGGWRDCAIVRPAGAVGGSWLRWTFLPLAEAEALYWNTLGRRLRTD